jgi:hypothetical protein
VLRPTVSISGDGGVLYRNDQRHQCQDDQDDLGAARRPADAEAIDESNLATGLCRLAHGDRRCRAVSRCGGGDGSHRDLASPDLERWLACAGS